jgi:hypothetical protein
VIAAAHCAAIPCHREYCALCCKAGCTVLSYKLLHGVLTYSITMVRESVIGIQLLHYISSTVVSEVLVLSHWVYRLASCSQLISISLHIAANTVKLLLSNNHALCAVTDCTNGHLQMPCASFRVLCYMHACVIAATRK